ncbi:hypothetical protein BXU11_07220 [Flavobacterium sp. LM5]|uniref:DUF6428 family protein n=1 Tax=Flavobacterium sp. LM5 TaxID=1938610 RepID=UPI00099268AE|nr:DUF6428 family protein [Flavobacterium sp. LM5]OOV29653.1 hypothetical protein BXU11_07220 [Flavobacterium sp. LM5]
MKVSEVKENLQKLEDVNFSLPNGQMIPIHFHVTEVGIVTKKFIDCGGTIRVEQVVNFQLWNANDTDHRLKPTKLLAIIELAEKALAMEDYEIEVEYQNETIGKYNLDFNGSHFLLVNKQTDCLAKDNCGIPETKQKKALINLGNTNNTCIPGGGCC